MEALQRMHNRGSISTEAYEIDNSVKFESANTESLTKSQTASNRKTWTLSFWFKRTKVNADLQYTFQANVSSSTVFDIVLNGITDWRISDYASGSRGLAFYSTVPLKDPSAWYHLVVACDTTQSSAADRFKVYLNGVQVDTISGYFSTAQYPAEDYETNINNSAATLSIGKSISASTNFCGYISEFNFIDGLMKDAEDFGRYDSASAIWTPIEYTGSYGSEGYFLNFADANSLGNDANGGTDFTKNNIAASDQALDTPTNNFCTLALGVRAGTSSEDAPIREGGTYMPIDGTNQFLNYFGTIGVTKGKWYWEVYIPSRSASYGLLDYIGLHSMQEIPVGASATGGKSQCNYVLHYGDYNATVNGTNSGQNTAAGLPSYGTNGAGKLFGVAFDATNGKITYYESGNRIGNLNIDIFDLHDDMADGIFVHPFIQVYDNNMYINFGGVSSWASPSDYDKTDANEYGSFAYTPPTGYYALCTKNLAEFG